MTLLKKAGLPRLLFDIFILAFLVYIILASLNLPSHPRLFPLVLSIAGIVLIVFRMLLSLKNGDYVTTTIKNGKKSLVLALILCMFLLLIYLFGFLVSSVLFTFFIVYKWANESLKTSLVCAAITFAAIYFVFISALGFPLYQGLWRFF